MAYLTKSRFKLGLSCITKLYYDSHRDKYANASQEDPFLLALAEGGFQVGELAKMMYPEGIDIDTLDTEEAIRLTEEALSQPGEVTIFEAAIRVDHCFIRVDILRKTERSIQVIEVKSKSCRGDDELQVMMADEEHVNSTWRPYIEDVIFQQQVVERYLIEKAWQHPVIPYLLCVDKDKAATVTGLHSMFSIHTDDRRRKMAKPIPGLKTEDIGESIMSKIKLDLAQEAILRYDYKQDHPTWQQGRFEEIIYWFEELLQQYEQGIGPVREPMSMECKNCPFRLPSGEYEGEIKSGHWECGRATMGWSDEQIWKPKVYDVWWYTRAKERIAESRWLMDQLQPEDLETKGNHWTSPEEGIPLSRIQRQWIQISQSSGPSHAPYVNALGLARAMDTVTYPLHFIDFETSAPAIPFFEGHRPYEGVCFQFSHHIMDAEGHVRHANEYLGMGQGEDPTWGFIEALYEALRHDEGSIFRYATHENTYLGYVRRALKTRSPFDAGKTQVLIDFIESITQPTGSVPKNEGWEPGPRNMIDLCQWVKDYYWHPKMAGSNSLKYVLPAILEHSEALQHKYRAPIYGAVGGIPSKNFRDHTWLRLDEYGDVCDPYSLLPDLHSELPSIAELDRIFSDEKLGNGGAAMTAWAYMQQAAMSEAEREGIRAGLLRYCELDTLAMVMLWEGWEALINEN